MTQQTERFLSVDGPRKAESIMWCRDEECLWTRTHGTSEHAREHVLATGHEVAHDLVLRTLFRIAT